MAIAETHGVAAGLLTGHRVLVTGAASGIGEAVAAHFEVAGAEVVRADLAASADIVACDVRSEADVAALFAGAGALTDVINCAGVAESAPIADTTLALWNQHIEINLTGSFIVAREAARSLSGSGAITFIASNAGLRGHADYTAYVASKFGVIGLARSLARELAPRRVRVNAVCPGGVRTPMVARTVAAEAARENVSVEFVYGQMDERVPIGRLADPGEVAAICCFLSSDLATHVAGAALVVDGAEDA